MFIQIVQGTVGDADRFNAEGARWSVDIKPGATGYLGCTWGLGANGTGFVAARFDSAGSTAANSARSEQGAWWGAMEPAFTEVSFRDCDQLDLMFGGGSDHAGFVQVIQGRVKDKEAARVMIRHAEEHLGATRPDILGGVMAWHGDEGDFTQIMYFRSEEAARAAEGTPDDSEVETDYRDMMAAEPTFIDLTDPHFD